MKHNKRWVFVLLCVVIFTACIGGDQVTKSAGEESVETITTVGVSPPGPDVSIQDEIVQPISSSASRIRRCGPDEDELCPTVLYNRTIFLLVYWEAPYAWREFSVSQDGSVEPTTELIEVVQLLEFGAVVVHRSWLHQNMPEESWCFGYDFDIPNNAMLLTLADIRKVSASGAVDWQIDINPADIALMTDVSRPERTRLYLYKCDEATKSWQPAEITAAEFTDSTLDYPPVECVMAVSHRWIDPPVGWEVAQEEIDYDLVLYRVARDSSQTCLAGYSCTTSGWQIEADSVMGSAQCRPWTVPKPYTH